MKIGLAIPTYNVEKTLPRVLAELSAVIDSIAEIVVVDNASTDGSRAAVEREVRSGSAVGRKLVLLKHTQNYGYGSSIKTAFDYLVARDLTHIVVIHSDDQTDWAAIVKRFLGALAQTPALDAVTGSRFLRESGISGYSRIRIFGNFAFNALTWVIAGARMSDSGAAIGCFRIATLREIPYSTFSNSWQFHPQLNLFLFGRSDRLTQEVPLDWKDAVAGGPKLNLLRYGLTLLRFLLRYRFQKTLVRAADDQIFKPEPVIHRKSIEAIPLR